MSKKSPWNPGVFTTENLCGFHFSREGIQRKGNNCVLMCISWDSWWESGSRDPGAKGLVGQWPCRILHWPYTAFICRWRPNFGHLLCPCIPGAKPVSIVPVLASSCSILSALGAGNCLVYGTGHLGGGPAQFSAISKEENRLGCKSLEWGAWEGVRVTSAGSELGSYRIRTLSCTSFFEAGWSWRSLPNLMILWLKMILGEQICSANTFWDILCLLLLYCLLVGDLHVQ